MEPNRELKTLNAEQLSELSRPLPEEAVSPHPTKKYLSSIKSIYVTERLNEVFGVGQWRIETDVVEKQDRMVVVKLKFTIPDYGIYYECYGGNDNSDLGDAYKGATTDAITKVASWLGIGADVFKGKYTNGKSPSGQSQTSTSGSTPSRQESPDNKSQAKKPLLMDHLANEKVCQGLLIQVYQANMLNAGKPFDPIAWLRERCEVSEDVASVFREKYRYYLQDKNKK